MAPSGTDLLLLIGGLLVIFQVVQGGIADSMRSNSDDPSLLGRFVSWIIGPSRVQQLPEFLRTNLGLERRCVKGEIGDGGAPASQTDEEDLT